MLIKVRCEHCERMLQAPQKAVGRRLPCPHCSALIPVEPAPHGVDTVFFDEECVLVTNLQVVTPEETYALEKITAATSMTQEYGRRHVLLACLSAFLLLWCPLSIILGSLSAGIVLLVNFVLSALAIIPARKLMRTRYWLVLTVAGDEVYALSSCDKAFVRRVVKAVNEAVLHGD